MQPWNKVKVIKPGMTPQTPSGDIIMKSLKNPCLHSVRENDNVKVFVKPGNM